MTSGTSGVLAVESRMIQRIAGEPKNSEIKTDNNSWTEKTNGHRNVELRWPPVVFAVRVGEASEIATHFPVSSSTKSLVGSVINVLADEPS